MRTRTCTGEEGGKGDAIEDTGKENALHGPALPAYQVGFAKGQEEHAVEPEIWDDENPNRSFVRVQLSCLEPT